LSGYDLEIVERIPLASTPGHHRRMVPPSTVPIPVPSGL
jgi:hypothetical protein